MATLEIRDLKVSVETDQGTKHILKGVDLSIEQGSIHAIMGPNGSGKSTLAYTIAGHPKYHVEGGSVLLDGQDVLAMTVDARARAGLFLAMQYPVEIPGVTVTNFHPDFVHVFVDGRIAEEGGPELADRLEDEGYDRYLAQPELNGTSVG
jgi:Fe-S cluster assembly ATPase SufC